MRALERVIALIPEFDGLTATDFEITRLPGYTNNIYRLRRGDDDWILRVPRAATNALLDRAAERHNQSIAVELGLAPAIRWQDSDGVTLTPTLAEPRDLRPGDFNDPSLRERVIEALRRLHRSGRKFHGEADLAALLARYHERLPMEERARFATRIEQSKWVIGRLETVDAAPVPSHKDLVLENLLLDGDRLWLIDWEFSSPASPYWDLATFANAAGLDYAQSRQLLAEYGVGAAPLDESVLFDYRGLLRLLEDLWMTAFARGGGDADA